MTDWPRSRRARAAADALRQPREQGYPVLDDDVARLSPFIGKHINVHGRYSFQRPQVGRRAASTPNVP
ncbi:Tn3 family transposase [Nonomuraea polychroma]|uniref:Tn3 family transposase n=1 Tax=Nonomuraea polychroma TaxID=46176 RepID=UPI003D8EEC8D